ncbi:hypothetical protein KC323_g232 [Hortaea werneckii]|nr:hypothetical protein KC323_g232 [Hortaea werneckii]
MSPVGSVDVNIEVFDWEAEVRVVSRADDSGVVLVGMKLVVLLDTDMAGIDKVEEKEIAVSGLVDVVGVDRKIGVPSTDESSDDVSVVAWTSSGFCTVGPVLEVVLGRLDEIVEKVRVAEEDSLLVGAIESDGRSSDVSLALDSVDSGEDPMLELQEVKSCSPEAAVLVAANWVDCNSEAMAVVEFEENVVEVKFGLENEKEPVTNTLVASSLEDEVIDRLSLKLDEDVSESGMLVEPTKGELSLNVMEVGELELDDLLTSRSVVVPYTTLVSLVVSVGAKIVFVLVMVEAACQISTARYQVWCRPKNPKKARNIHNCRSKNRFYAAEFRFRCPTELRETRNRDIVTPCVINDKRYMLRSPNMDARLQSRDLVNGLTFQSRRSIDKPVKRCVSVNVGPERVVVMFWSEHAKLQSTGSGPSYRNVRARYEMDVVVTVVPALC